MSISEKTAKEHANDPAVLCCRAEKGITLSSHNLEDPAIFDDLVDSGLLNLDGCLKIGQVLGAVLTRTCDSLTPLTPDVIDHIVESAPDSSESGDRGDRNEEKDQSGETAICMSRPRRYPENIHRRRQKHSYRDAGGRI